MDAKHFHPAQSVLEQYKKEYLKLLEEIGEKTTLARGELLRKKDMYYLRQGVCALCMSGESGKDLSIIYFFPGRLFNFLPSLQGFYPRTSFPVYTQAVLPDFFVKAISDCELLRINHAKFLDIFFYSLPLQTLIIQALVDNCYDLFSHIFSSADMPAWQRVAMELLGNMETVSPHALKWRITYAEIATHLSLHVVTVAKICKALLRANVIRKEKSVIFVNDPERLLRIAQGRERIFYKEKQTSDDESEK